MKKNAKRKLLILMIFGIVAVLIFDFPKTKPGTIYKKKAAAFLKQAEDLYDKRLFEKSYVFYKKAASQFARVPDYPNLAYCYNVMGLCKKKEGKYAEALKCYKKALAYADGIRNAKEKDLKIAIISYNIAVVFDGLKFYRKALSFYNTALRKYKKLGKNDDYNYGKVDLGIVYRKMGDFDKAIDLQKQSYLYFKKTENTYFLCLTTNNLAYSYLKKGDLGISEIFHLEALKIAEQNKIDEMLPYIYSGLGELYQKKGDLKKALFFQKKAERLSNDRELLEYIYSALYSVNLSLGNKEKAADYLKRYNDLISSQYNTDIYESIEEIVRLVESEKAAEKERLLQKERKIQNLLKNIVVLGVILGFVFAGFLIYRVNVKKKMSTYLELLSKKDPLTGLYNRRGILEKIEREAEIIQRTKKPFSIAICDIDDFKKINDTFGHGAGDLVLRQLAVMFMENLRKADAVARWGGEEFLFFFPETNIEGAYATAEKLRILALEKDFFYNGLSFAVTLTFGIAEYKTGYDIQSVIDFADKALYRGKKTGKNKTVKWET